MKRNSKLVTYLMFALTIFVVRPLDYIVFASVFGSVLFGFGTVGFYCFSIIMALFSVLLWRARGRKKLQLKEAERLRDL